MKQHRVMILLAVVTATVVFVGQSGLSRSSSAEAPAFAGPTERAVFSGGCFWGLQAAFDELPGVVKTRVGYTGGTTANPSYELVVAGGTGHAEAVEVTFDPARVSYEDLVRYFFEHHRCRSDEMDSSYPTRAYRSAIFVVHADQREVAERIRGEVAAANEGDGKPVVTLVEAVAPFWEAEAYHQKYLTSCPH